MSTCYVEGAERWKRHTGGDPRGYRPPKGWEASAHLIDNHPSTGRPFRNGSQWWIRETFEGDN